MPVAGDGVSNFAYTTDGRAEGVSALNNGSTNSVGGAGVAVQYASEPGAITHILAQNSNFITAQNDNQIITE